MLVYRFLWILYAPGVLSPSGRLMHSGRGRRLYGISLKVYRKFPASENDAVKRRAKEEQIPYL